MGPHAHAQVCECCYPGGTDFWSAEVKESVPHQPAQSTPTGELFKETALQEEFSVPTASLLFTTGKMVMTTEPVWYELFSWFYHFIFITTNSFFINFRCLVFYEY